MSVSVLSGFGSHHTNKNGDTLPTITLADIRALVDHPQAVEKAAAQWLIPSTLHSRSFEEQREKGSFWYLWSDLDKDPPPLSALADIVRNTIGGCCYEIYTSRSATAERQKSRVIIPLSKPLSGSDWQRCQQVLNNRIEAAGYTPDRAAERAAQLCYLPNRGEFYDTRTERQGSHFDPLLAFAADLAALPIDPPKPVIKKQREAQVGVSLIDTFNAAYTVEDILTSHGYDRKGSQYRHPQSESGSYSASVKDGRVHALSPADPLYSEGKAHDAFSAFTVLAHGGNHAAACKDAGDNWLMLDGESWNKAKQRQHMQQQQQHQATDTAPATPATPAPVLGDEMDITKDLAALSSCPAENQQAMAKKLLGRYAHQTPRKRGNGELIALLVTQCPELDPRKNDLESYLGWITAQAATTAVSAVQITYSTVHAATMEAARRMIAAESANVIWLIKAAMGSGKTSKLLRPIALGEQSRVVAVSHRQSLVSDLCNRLELTDYRHIGRDDESAAMLGICVNSLANTKKYGRVMGDCQTLLIDEISQVLREVFNPKGTIAALARRHKYPASRVWNALVAMMNTAKTVAGCDADLNDQTIAAIQAACPDKQVKVIVVDAPEMPLHVDFSERNTAWHTALSAVADNQRLLFCADSAKECERMAAAISKQNPEKRIALVHSGKATATAGEPEVQALLADINTEIQKYDALIYSPTIASGVSIETKWFDAHVAVYRGTVAPSDFLQMLRRDRTAERFMVGFNGGCHLDGETSPAVLLTTLEGVQQQQVAVLDELAMRVVSEPATEYDRQVCIFTALENQSRIRADNGFIHLLSHCGVSSARIDEIELSRSVLKDAKAVVNEKYAEAVINAQPIDRDTAASLKQQHQTTRDESAQLEAHALRDTMGLDATAPLDDTHIDLWQGGKLAGYVANMEALQAVPGQLIAGDIAEAETQPIATRRYRAGLSQALRDTFEALEIDPVTGEGDITAHTAREAWLTLRDSQSRARLEHAGLARFAHEPKRPTIWVSRLLEKLGLSLKCHKTAQQRVYSIAPESWGTMLSICTQRAVHFDSVHFDPLYIKEKPKCPDSAPATSTHAMAKENMPPAAAPKPDDPLISQHPHAAEQGKQRLKAMAAKSGYPLPDLLDWFSADLAEIGQMDRMAAYHCIKNYIDNPSYRETQKMEKSA